jgi:hypothetical protein
MEEQEVQERVVVMEEVAVLAPRLMDRMERPLQAVLEVQGIPIMELEDGVIQLLQAQMEEVEEVELMAQQATEVLVRQGS